MIVFHLVHLVYCYKSSYNHITEIIKKNFQNVKRDGKLEEKCEEATKISSSIHTTCVSIR